MEILNKGICQVCEIEQVIGLFRGKWTCGRCMLKFEDKIRQHNNKILDIIEREIKDENPPNN